MEKFYYIILIVFFIACSKDEYINEEELIENQSPNSFEIQILNLSHDSATISWSEAVDPDNDSVTYTIYLNNELIGENNTELTYEFTGLEELTSYSGKIIAKDSNDNQIEVNFSFQTEKYYLKFLKRFDYGEYEYGPNNYSYGSPYSMIKTNDQNYVIAGHTNFYTNGYRFFVLKVDYQGNELWKKFYDYQVGDATDFKIIQSQTGFILVGRFHVLSLDADGNIIWYKKIDSYDIEIYPSAINSVALDSAGNIFLVGDRPSNAPLPSAPHISVLTKLNSSGTLIWEKIFDTSYMSFFKDVVITNNNEVLIFGASESTSRSFEEIEQSNFQDIDFWVVKTDINGETIWENNYSRGGHAFPTQIIVKSNNNYVLAGYVWGLYDISSGKIFEISSSGDEVWDITTGLSNVFSIAETLDSGLITTGHVTFGSYGALGIYKFSSTGILQWSKQHQESFTYLYGRSILAEEDGGYRIAGSLSQNYYYNDERPELLIYKTDPLGNYD